MQSVTLLFLRREHEILLAMKKRGFGVNKWNGVGGKVEPGETIIQAAIREAKEEIGVTPHEPQLVGRLHFYFAKDPTFEHDCHIFITNAWGNEPRETEEMRPQWFAVTNIPYQHMWASDKLWLPLLLDGQYFTGTATLDGDSVTRHDIRTVKKLGAS